MYGKGWRMLKAASLHSQTQATAAILYSYEMDVYVPMITTMLRKKSSHELLSTFLKPIYLHFQWGLGEGKTTSSSVGCYVCGGISTFPKCSRTLQALVYMTMSEPLAACARKLGLPTYQKDGAHSPKMIIQHNNISMQCF